MATIALKASPHLNWRRTWLGGAVAVGGFAALVLGFMVMRAFGIGPMGSLQGKGVLGSREVLVVADFRGPAADAELGPTVAEALRTDLGQSAAFNVLSRATLRELLGLMERPAETVVQFDLAREIATREGAKAVLDGEVVRLGQGYVISARLVSALDGSELATFRQEAANEDALLPALSRLSRAVRERAGESLRVIRASTALERVTTPSLAALRKYVEGSRVAEEEGDRDRGLVLLQEAVEIDTAFAMAWRKIAVTLRNMNRERDRSLAAFSAAYRHRDRLTEMERLLTEASYFSFGPVRDLDRALAAYEQMLAIDSLSGGALNNAANLLAEKREFERAENLLRREIRRPRPFSGAYFNLLTQQSRMRRSPEALDSTVAAFRVRFPASADLRVIEAMAALGSRDSDRADSIGRVAYAEARSAAQQIRSAWFVSSIADQHGRPREGLRWVTQATQTMARTQPSATSRLQFALDSMYYATYFDQDPDAARQFLARGLAREPLEEIPPSERPWRVLAEYAAAIGDPGLAQQALVGFEGDQLTIGVDQDGDRAYYRAALALASQQWDVAISHLHVADARPVTEPDYILAQLGRAHDMAGRPDSAIAYFERIVATNRAQPFFDGVWLPRLHKRLGELHEAKGDTEKAIANYARFVNLWRNAEPELQPQVREVSQRLERLRAGRG